MIIPLFEENRKVWYDADKQATEYSVPGTEVPAYSQRREAAVCKGIGLDLCQINRMEKLVTEERFLNRFFNPEEISYIRSKGKNRAQTLAGIFAAKEAVCKALGTGVAFDLRGYRIGFGAGCYDQFLPLLMPDTPVIALAHEMQILERVPEDAHDIPCDHIITESRILSCRR